MVNEGTATSVRLFISLHIHFSLEKQLTHFLNVSGFGTRVIQQKLNIQRWFILTILHACFAPFPSFVSFCFISKHISGFSVVKSCCGTLSLAKVLIYSWGSMRKVFDVHELFKDNTFKNNSLLWELLPSATPPNLYHWSEERYHERKRHPWLATPETVLEFLFPKSLHILSINTSVL